VCSLNVSRVSQKTFQKLTAITKGGHDIIFLSDLRLNSNKQKSAVHDIEKRLSFKGYRFFHNSTSNSRGVGILVSTKINANLEICYTDLEQNIILLKMTVGNQIILIVAVYGPNNDER
jgi:exonuclease III